MTAPTDSEVILKEMIRRLNLLDSLAKWIDNELEISIKELTYNPLVPSPSWSFKNGYRYALQQVKKQLTEKSGDK